VFIILNKMGNKLCDCNKRNENDRSEMDFNQPHTPFREDSMKPKELNFMSMKEDGSTLELNKEDEMKIEVIDSYDIENNIYNIDYLKNLIKLQRRVKSFIYYKRSKEHQARPKKHVMKNRLLSLHSFDNKNISNSLISHDMQSVVSRQSSKISMNTF
jgi:hypothetical protein